MRDALCCTVYGTVCCLVYCLVCCVVCCYRILKVLVHLLSPSLTLSHLLSPSSPSLLLSPRISLKPFNELSGKSNDACGVCGGDNSLCKGCDGVPNSGQTTDACGVCGGDGSSCAGCDGVANSGTGRRHILLYPLYTFYIPFIHPHYHI